MSSLQSHEKSISVVQQPHSRWPLIIALRQEQQGKEEAEASKPFLLCTYWNVNREQEVLVSDGGLV